jgi:uncharacterized protein (TIGR00369 family)
MSENETAFAFVSRNLAATPFHHWLKPELLEADDVAGKVVIKLATREDFARAPGRPEVHGGIVAALIDIAGHAAVAARLRHGAATIDMRVDYLRLASGPELRAEARIVKFGRTVSNVDVQIDDENGKTIAIGRCLYLSKKI